MRVGHKQKAGKRRAHFRELISKLRADFLPCPDPRELNISVTVDKFPLSISPLVNWFVLLRVILSSIIEIRIEN